MADEYLEVRREGGAEVVPLDGERLTLGRSPNSAVAFPSDESMSRSHAVLERGTEGWLLRDAGSSNGTYVNGTELVGAHVLRSGDEVVLGSSRVVFHAGEAGTTPLPLAGAEPRADAPPPPAESVAGGYLDLSEEWGPQRPSARAREERRDEAPDDGPRAPRSTGGAPTSPPIVRGHGSGRVRGVARGIQVRRRDQDRDILTFRIDQYDASGNRLAPVAVELTDFEGGHVSDGEEVEVTGRWSRGTLKANRVVNLSTSAEVRGRGMGTKIALACAIILILCFFAFIAYSIITAPTVEDPFK